MKTLAPLFLTTLLLAANATHAGTRVIDGNDSDWTGTPPLLVHDIAISGDEWIYKGESGDVRTDPSGTLGNYDLTEVRLTNDNTYLYVLLRYAGLTSLNEVSFCMGFDLDQSASDSNGLTFNGDDSGVLYGAPEHHPEYLVHVHNSPNSYTEVEFFHDAGLGSWYNTSASENIAFISLANNLVEVRLRLTDLELTPTSSFAFSLVTFDNGTTSDPSALGFNNVTDTTVDYPHHDGLDALGGQIGVTENAFTRAFNGTGATILATAIRPVSLPTLSHVESWMMLVD
jgi:hypothetical protein